MKCRVTVTIPDYPPRAGSAGGGGSARDALGPSGGGPVWGWRGSLGVSPLPCEWGCLSGSASPGCHTPCPARCLAAAFPSRGTELAMIDQNMNPVRLFLNSTLFSALGGIQAHVSKVLEI